MSRRTSLISLLAAPALAAPLALLPASPAVAADPPPVTVAVTALQLRVLTGTPGVDERPCNVDADLYTPSTATPPTPVPAVLTTNGFGGSKADQAALAGELATRGYVVLSYTGLGFGGSSCDITNDDRAHDGRAASQLVSFLGGAGGLAFATYTRGATTASQAWSGPVPWLADVRHDPVGSADQEHPHDPRVGLVGGSYGGEVQLAAAAVDPRIDTVVPLITWHDLV